MHLLLVKYNIRTEFDMLNYLMRQLLHTSNAQLAALQYNFRFITTVHIRTQFFRGVW